MSTFIQQYPSQATVTASFSSVTQGTASFQCLSAATNRTELQTGDVRKSGMRTGVQLTLSGSGGDCYVLYGTGSLTANSYRSDFLTSTSPRLAVPSGYNGAIQAIFMGNTASLSVTEFIAVVP